MNERSLRRCSLRSALAAALLLAVSGAAMPALAADDDDEPSFETKIFNAIFGINDKDKIDYRERPGLVVPPSLSLPPPETTASVPNPAWPKDADKQPKKKKVDETRKNRRYSDPTVEESRPLTPAELERGRLAGAGVSGGGGSGNPDLEGMRTLKPNELGYRGGLFGDLFRGKDKKEEAATPPPESPRTSLIEPPPGYMTPAAGQVYGLSKRKEAPKPFKLEDRGTGND
ncbi:MAG: hypothetical protein HXY30_06485 [Pseudorhodoplanes sp.]|nr:hypothetical protein [Pseudorhodoplanes sp.]